MPALAPYINSIENFSVTTLLLWAAVSAILSYFFASTVYYAFFHPLAKIPGPRLYSFTQLPFLYHTVRGDWDQKLKELHDQYGPAVRISHKDVSFNTANALKKIFGHKSAPERTFEKEPNWYKNDHESSSIITADNDNHRRFRRLLSHAFSEKALRAQESVLDQYIDKFILKLTQISQKGAALDIVSWYNFTTFDVIGDFAFGEPFGCLDTGTYHPWIPFIFESIKFVPLRMAAERLGLGLFLPFLMPTRLKRSREENFQLSQATALKRAESQNTEREDFMSYILRHNDERGMTPAEIAENAAIIVPAGSETTATLLSGTTHLLLTNRCKYDKLVAEIRSEFGREEDITLTRVNKLPYLIAVLNEGFRMYPPVPAPLPRVAPVGGEEVEGFWIPEKTVVVVSHWATFRSENNFRDADKYVPERWLDDPQYAGDSKDALQPFSYGPRNCIGRNLAYAEMRLILARLIWNFDLELVPGGENWFNQRSFLIWEKGGYMVKLTRVDRKQNKEV
ncbi:hypothetical protein FDECE_2696 [Fusarium decemcellulare]|nr:hypothetical protein FDECE_2696 [Fusarium decemcellulare]